MDKPEALTARAVPFLMNEDGETEITLYFAEGAPDLPFVDIETAAELLRKAYAGEGFSD